MVIRSYEKAGIKLTIYQDTDAENPREWDNLGRMVCYYRKGYRLGDEQVMNTGCYVTWNDWLQGELVKPNGGEGSIVYLPLYLFDHSGLSIRTIPFVDSWDSTQIGFIYATKQRFREETGYNEDELFSKDKDRTPKVGDHVRVNGGSWGKVMEARDTPDGTAYVVDFDYNKSPSFRKPENVVMLEGPIEVMTNRAEEMLKNEVATYDDYLCGNVYGFVLEKKEVCECCGNVTYDSIDSCWGFYGDSALEDMKDNVADEYRYLFDLV